MMMQFMMLFGHGTRPQHRKTECVCVCAHGQTEGKAEERLRRINPKLCGRNAVVNIGDFWMKYPA
jgi:hypothetical protein